jgi:hypothetical protein
MSIKTDIAEQVDWAYWISCWAHKLLNDKYPGYSIPGTERADTYAPGGYHYAHIAEKYLQQCDTVDGQPLFREEVTVMRNMLKDLTKVARRYAVSWGVPLEFLPTLEDSTLRLLYYPPGTYIAEHTDFNLFTVNLWRSDSAYYRHDDEHHIAPADTHIGEIWGQLIGEPATLHWTDKSAVAQYSAVFFAMPPLDAVLPDGTTVRAWLDERKRRSR